MEVAVVADVFGQLDIFSWEKTERLCVQLFEQTPNGHGLAFETGVTAGVIEQLLCHGEHPVDSLIHHFDQLELARVLALAGN